MLDSVICLIKVVYIIQDIAAIISSLIYTTYLIFMHLYMNSFILFHMLTINIIYLHHFYYLDTHASSTDDLDSKLSNNLCTAMTYLAQYIEHLDHTCHGYISICVSHNYYRASFSHRIYSHIMHILLFNPS